MGVDKVAGETGRFCIDLSRVVPILDSYPRQLLEEAIDAIIAVSIVARELRTNTHPEAIRASSDHEGSFQIFSVCFPDEIAILHIELDPLHLNSDSAAVILARNGDWLSVRFGPGAKSPSSPSNILNSRVISEGLDTGASLARSRRGQVQIRGGADTVRSADYLATLPFTFDENAECKGAASALLEGLSVAPGRRPGGSCIGCAGPACDQVKAGLIVLSLGQVKLAGLSLRAIKPGREE